MRAEVNAALITDAWTEIAKPQPGHQAKIEQDFENAATRRRAFAPRRDETTPSAFLLTLSPAEQRSKFVSLLREHRAFWMLR